MLGGRMITLFRIGKPFGKPEEAVLGVNFLRVRLRNPLPDLLRDVCSWTIRPGFRIKWITFLCFRVDWIVKRGQ
jgi:hypothetical protein